MELTLTHEEKTTKKTYRHFTITAANGTATGEKKKTDFFYIGHKTGSIDNLIRAFETGYAAETTENAKFILKRLTQKDNSVPGVFIMDATISSHEIEELYNTISKLMDCRTIPFIIDMANASPANLARLKKLEFVDEILSLESYDPNALFSKINFLSKIKKNRIKNKNNQAVETSGSKIYGTKSIAKRVFDIVISSMLLLALTPLFLLIAIAIKIESKGPVFYISPRAGRGYRVFNFFKFRTMFTGADKQVKDFLHLNQYNTDQSEGPVFFKINNDPRITKVGMFLRNSSLDELPQLVNVLIGDMSLVGNRPLPLYEAATLTTDEWAKRFLAPAGITGLWQIKKRGQDEMSTEERISLDIDYAEKYNFMYDLWIMANTPSALLQKSNA